MLTKETGEENRHLSFPAHFLNQCPCHEQGLLPTSSGRRQDFKITGVFKNIPENSHLRFDFLARFEDYAARHFDQWGISNYYTYVLVSNTYSQTAYNEKLPGFIENTRERMRGISTSGSTSSTFSIVSSCLP